MQNLDLSKLTLQLNLVCNFLLLHNWCSRYYRVMEDYSTDTFISGFIRFLCRFGYPKYLLPDLTRGFLTFDYLNSRVNATFMSLEEWAVHLGKLGEQ